MKMAITESSIFKKFNLKLLDSALAHFKIKHYNKNQTVLQSGHEMSSMIVIIIQGTLIDVRNLFNVVNKRKYYWYNRKNSFRKRVIFDEQ